MSVIGRTLQRNAEFAVANYQFKMLTSTYSATYLLSFLFFYNFNTFNCLRVDKTCGPLITVHPQPTVNIPHFGEIKGTATSSLKKKRTIFQYLSIPYVQPISQSGRFKPSVPYDETVKNYTSYDCRYFNSQCPQLVSEEDYKYMQDHSGDVEDCLYLNVFTVTNEGENSKRLLPVLIYIHGGGYYQGSAWDHCPNYLLDHDIILVTLQYRLGPFGFLNLETEEVPGNMGLVDTLHAIEWVSRNIKYFGGDNRRITISGQSAGGNSVSLLLVSPLVRPGLFHQAIVQSGNFLGDWAMDSNSKHHALEFAQYVNCSNSNLTNVVQCLKLVPSIDILKVHLHKYMVDRMKCTENAVKEIGIAHAVVQKSGSKKFLTEYPRESLKNGRFLKVPVMTGVTRDEGLMVLESLQEIIVKPAFKRLFINERNRSAYLNNKFFYDVIKFNGVSENIDQLELLKATYIPEDMCNEFSRMVRGIADLSGTLFMKTKVLEFARYMRKYVPTYLYSFNFNGRKTKLGYGKPVKHQYFDGVAHSDELLYLFPYSKDPSLNEEEEKIVGYITGLWSSFVINGGKNISVADLTDWPSMNSSVGPYLQIDKKLIVKENFLNEYKSTVSETESQSTATRFCLENTLSIFLLITFFILCT